jgi:hypothetical protein
VFAYGETFLNLTKWDAESCIPGAPAISETYMRHVEYLAQKGPLADGRVTIGIGFDGYHLPQQEVKKLFGRAIKAGVKLITSHCGNFGKNFTALLH